MVGKKTRTGSVPEGDARLSVNVDKKLHKRLKIEAAKRETTVGEIIEQLIKKHLSHLRRCAIGMITIRVATSAIETFIDELNSIAEDPSKTEFRMK